MITHNRAHSWVTFSPKAVLASGLLFFFLSQSLNTIETLNVAAYNTFAIATTGSKESFAIWGLYVAQ